MMLLVRLFGGLLFSVTMIGCASTDKSSSYEPDLKMPPERFAQIVGAAEVPESSPNSLWRNDPSSLFGDRRAKGLGDILTVVISVNDQAQMQNSITQDRTNNEQFSANSLFGFPQWANNVLPGGATVAPGVDVTRSRAASGSGNINRQEQITLRLAARIVDVLPNGHMVVAGVQEIQVNHETRLLKVTGVVRPEDISRQNTVGYDKIAEARIAYGGNGQVSSTVARQPGSRLLDLVVPF